MNEMLITLPIKTTDEWKPTLVGTYTAVGTYTIENVEVGKPIIFGISSTETGHNFGVYFKIVEGSLIGLSSYTDSSGGGAFYLGRRDYFASSCSCIIIPTASTFVFQITYDLIGTNTTLYVYQ